MEVIEGVDTRCIMECRSRASTGIERQELFDLGDFTSVDLTSRERSEGGSTQPCVSLVLGLLMDCLFKIRQYTQNLHVVVVGSSRQRLEAGSEVLAQCNELAVNSILPHQIPRIVTPVPRMHIAQVIPLWRVKRQVYESE